MKKHPPRAPRRDTAPPEPAGHPHGKTAAAQGELQEPVPRMPHERDESADEQAPQRPPDLVGRLAHEDARRGRPDTSRASQSDETYHRLRQEPAPGPREAPSEHPDRGVEIRPEGPGASRR